MFETLFNCLQGFSYSSLLGLILLSAFAIANAKALPLTPTLRLLPAVWKLLKPRLFRPKKARESKNSESIASLEPLLSGPVSAVHARLFQQHVMTSRAVALDLDINLHKSNSTFFADADVGRTRLLAELLSQGLAELGPANFILAGAQCRFQREIKPYQAYDVVSRLLAWTDRTLYVVTYFVRPGTELPFEVEVMHGPQGLMEDGDLRRNVFATLVTKFVFKVGRTTVAPEKVLRASGLFVDGDRKGMEGPRRAVIGSDDLERALRVGLDYVTRCME